MFCTVQEFTDGIVQLDSRCMQLYIDEPGEYEEKELGFWKIIKDCEYLLRYGYSYIDRKKRKQLTKSDPIEYTDEYLRVELKMERLIREEIGEGGYKGFCHKYWLTMKHILKEQFGIEWKSPADLNPNVHFD